MELSGKRSQASTSGAGPLSSFGVVPLDAVTQGEGWHLHRDVKEALAPAPACPAPLDATVREASCRTVRPLTRAAAPCASLGARAQSRGSLAGRGHARRPASAPVAAARRPGRGLVETPGAYVPPGAAAEACPATPSSGSCAAGSAAPAMRRSRSCQAYLREFRLLQEAKASARSASAEHAGSASLYRHLCHMSEANALAEDLGLPTRYRPHRRQGGKEAGEEVICRVYEDGELTTEVPLPFFERRFKALQSRWNQLGASKAEKADVAGAKGAQLAAKATGQAAAPAAGPRGSRGVTGATRPATLLSPDAQGDLQRQIKMVTLETLALADRMWQQADVLK